MNAAVFWVKEISQENAEQYQHLKADFCCACSGTDDDRFRIPFSTELRRQIHGLF